MNKIQIQLNFYKLSDINKKHVELIFDVFLFIYDYRSVVTLPAMTTKTNPDKMNTISFFVFLS